MPQMTLLEMTQNILSEMDGDEVNSVNDTVEALQVANVIKTTYFNIIDGKTWQWLKTLFQLTSSGDVNKPTHMVIPTDVIDIEFVKYNIRTSTDTRDKFQDITYKTPADFLAILEKRDSSDSTVDTITDYGGSPLYILNNTAPSYWTSFDDTYIVFDSYDSDVEATSQTAKTQCYGQRYPTFTMSDSFVPDLPVQMFSYLLSESKSTCFISLKQTANSKAEQNSVSQRRRMSQQSWKTAKGITYPNYGRK